MSDEYVDPFEIEHLLDSPIIKHASIGPNDAIPMLDLSEVPWPAQLHYDQAHGENTAKLSAVIITRLDGGLDLHHRELAILWVASLFHDLGRETGHMNIEVGHNRTSAEIADKILASDPRFCFDEQLREGVGRLITQHDIHRELEVVKSYGPLAMALHDADCYEAARLIRSSGSKVFKERTDASRLCSDWAKQRENRLRWMEWRMKR